MNVLSFISPLRLLPPMTRLLLCLLALAAGMGFSPSPTYPKTNPDIWRFPHLRGVYRDSIVLGRRLREDGATTETMQLMATTAAKSPAHRMGASLAAQDYLSTTTLSRAETTRLREDILLQSANEIRWGPHPLWDRLNVPVLGNGEAFPLHLLDNMKSDDISWNGQNAPEIYILGLQEDPKRFLPPLVTRWEEAIPSADEQEAVLLASLLLIYASQEQEDFHSGRLSWYFHSFGRSGESWGNHALMSPREKAAVLDAAEWSTPRWRYRWYGDGMDRPAAGNRLMGWRLIERLSPAPIEVLRRIALSEEHDRIERQRAIAIWMLRDVDSLLMPANFEAYLQVTLLRQWPMWAPELFSLLLSDERGDEYWEWQVGKELEELLFTADGDGIPHDVSRIVARREGFLALLRAALAEERHPYNQIILARLLRDARDPLATDLILQSAISNLANDDFTDNATNGAYLVEAVAEDSPEEVVTALLAGFEVGVAERDWQLIAQSAQLLAMLDSDFRPGDNPEAMAIMAECLYTDDVDGNAAAARGFLRICGTAAVPYLQTALTSGDEEAARIARVLLRELE